MKKSQAGGLLLELDFAKAYDSVDWNFLMNMMAELGVGERRLAWMQ